MGARMAAVKTGRRCILDDLRVQNAEKPLDEREDDGHKRTRLSWSHMYPGVGVPTRVNTGNQEVREMRRPGPVSSGNIFLISPSQVMMLIATECGVIIPTDQGRCDWCGDVECWASSLGLWKSL